ncbi:MAG: hypothetical protein AUJ07_03980 [Crenarchaeota archaeon 13_1_40CM_3_53_5]|nr:MAG: hypothetical protein AUJ07_03980 [Crenarchaeota archaeon 13_1_40CM_3_53_5]
MNGNRRILGADLRLIDDEEGADLELSPTGDLETVSSEFNLGQAILSRFRTRKGELRELGHEAFGSRLYELVGQPNNQQTREQVKAIVKEALLEEPRVKEIVRIEVRPDKLQKDRVNVNVSVIPIGQEVALNIVMPFYLEVA